MEPRSLETAHNIRTALTVLLLCALTVTVRAADEPTNKITPLPAEAPAWLDGYRVRYVLHVSGERAKSTSTSIIARVPIGNLAKVDATDVTVVTAAGKQLPVLILSHDIESSTLIQFPREVDDAWFWVYAGNPAATAPVMKPVQEGLTVEFREWAGEDIDSWASVRDGLSKSTQVQGAFAVAEVMQNGNAARPGRPTDFTASYRGYLKIEKKGVYRFFVNGDDASFLFIDGFKVCERPGSNVRVSGKLPLATTGANIELDAGVHPFEIHHVTGRSPGSYGICTFLWFLPEAKNWAFLPREAFVQADYGRVAAMESPPRTIAAIFAHGIDDSITTQSGVKLYLVRFQAHGSYLPAVESQLQWDFGDNTTGTGTAPTHIYFGDGDYTVTLKTGGDTNVFTQVVHVWPVPGRTSPFSAGKVIQVVSQSDWKNYDPVRLGLIFDFLQVSEHPDRWSLLEQISAHLIEQDDGVDKQFRAQLASTRIEALARIGRADEAIKFADKILPEFERVASLSVAIRLAKARVHHRHLKQYAVAAQQYDAIIKDNRRLEHPLLRVAAIRWGDLCAESGDMAQAAECYRLAGTLGGSDFQTTAQSEAMTRGARLRIAEQKLRSGDIRETRSLLEKIEINYPEQKLEGLYRFLRAESDRIAGRYEDALINYEVMLKLTQWSGFRDKTIFGIADTYYRMGEYERAHEWYATLKESYPAYYEKQKLEPKEKMLDEVIELRKAGVKPFKSWETDFEPEENQFFGSTGEFGTESGLGIAGPHVMVLDGFPVYRGYLEFSRDLPDLDGDVYYWVELWYRESLVQSPIALAPHIHSYLFGPANALHAGFNYEGTSYFHRTYGEWQKFGFIHRTPMVHGGRIAASIRQVIGVMEFDGLKVQRITDQQYDALFNFIEGTAGEGDAGE